MITKALSNLYRRKQACKRIMSQEDRKFAIMRSLTTLSSKSSLLYFTFNILQDGDGDDIGSN